MQSFKRTYVKPDEGPIDVVRYRANSKQDDWACSKQDDWANSNGGWLHIGVRTCAAPSAAPPPNKMCQSESSEVSYQHNSSQHLFIHPYNPNEGESDYSYLNVAVEEGRSTRHNSEQSNSIGRTNGCGDMVFPDPSVNARVRVGRGRFAEHLSTLRLHYCSSVVQR